LAGKSAAKPEKLMLRSKQFSVAVVSIFALTLFSSEAAVRLPAQNKPATAITASEKLSEQETRGEGLFLQRCSICHLPRKLKFGSPATAGPSLTGLFKEAGPDDLKVLRGIILKGSPNMPGFQYGLEPRQVDDLIVFLRTL
jgi:mono/diheme cytochrome c family protein